MWTFWSKITFGLQIIHHIRFKMHLEPAKLVFECLYQSTNISNNARIHLCPHIYKIWRIEKPYWCHLFDIKNSAWHRHHKTSEITPLSIFYGHNLGKKSGCLHLVKVQSETWSWSTGRGLSLMHTYEPGVLEWRLSGEMHIRGTYA